MRRLLVLALLIAPPAFADLAVTALRGRVTAAGDPRPGVQVTLTSAALQQPRVTETAFGGAYWIEALPPGVYDVTFSAGGFQTLTQRVVVELGRVSRSDAALDATEDDEIVTSTATSISVADTIPLTTHRTAAELERFPVYGGVAAVAYAAPGALHPFGGIYIDEVPADIPIVIPAESVDEVTLTHAREPLLSMRATGTAIHARTKSGGETLSFSLRDTISSSRWNSAEQPWFVNDDGIAHLVESGAGGRIVSGRLWFFASAIRGKRSDWTSIRQNGADLKLTAQPGATHNVVGTYRTSDESYTLGQRVEASTVSLHHTGYWRPRLLTELVAARHTASLEGHGLHGERSWLAGRMSYSAGDHVVSGGAEWDRGLRGEETSLFFRHRWFAPKWTLQTALSYTTAPVLPVAAPGQPFEPADTSGFGGQIAAAYDLGGDGRRTLIASATRHPHLFGRIDELSAGYAAAIGASGVVRVDAILREFGGRSLYSAQFAASYRLFDRFGAGTNYTWSDESHAAIVAQHSANAWIDAALPISTHILSGTVVQRYARGRALLEDYSATTTDVALRYFIPFSRFGLTLASDITDLFGDARAFRLWIRLRV